jgi:hypothetical protein
LVLFVRSKTIMREDGRWSGRERPVSSDGRENAHSLIRVTRYATGDALPKSALVARLGIDAGSRRCPVGQSLGMKGPPGRQNPRPSRDPGEFATVSL